jgi:hypothetical protein
LRPLLFRDQAGRDARRIDHHVSGARHVDDEIEDLGAPSRPTELQRIDRLAFLDGIEVGFARTPPDP